jgi:hypothetical protein
MDEEHRCPRKAHNQPLVRYAAIPSEHDLRVNEEVKAKWKGLGYQGSLWPARVVSIDVENQTYGLVFTDQTSQLLGHVDDTCPWTCVWRFNGIQPPPPGGHNEAAKVAAESALRAAAEYNERAKAEAPANKAEAAAKKAAAAPASDDKQAAGAGGSKKGAAGGNAGGQKTVATGSKAGRNGAAAELSLKRARAAGAQGGKDAEDEEKYDVYYHDIVSCSLQEGTAEKDFAKRLKFKINSSLKIKGKFKKQKPEEVSLQDMMTNEAYAPTQHDRDVFARCVGDFLVKILNTPPSAEAKNAFLPGL